MTLVCHIDTEAQTFHPGTVQNIRKYIVLALHIPLEVAILCESCRKAQGGEEWTFWLKTWDRRTFFFFLHFMNPPFRLCMLAWTWLILANPARTLWTHYVDSRDGPLGRQTEELTCTPSPSSLSPIPSLVPSSALARPKPYQGVRVRDPVKELLRRKRSQESNSTKTVPPTAVRTTWHVIPQTFMCRCTVSMPKCAQKMVSCLCSLSTAPFSGIRIKKTLWLPGDITYRIE